jgi:hypothetical protein
MVDFFKKEECYLIGKKDIYLLVKQLTQGPMSLTKIELEDYLPQDEIVCAKFALQSTLLHAVTAKGQVLILNDRAVLYQITLQKRVVQL